jgi:hypothetical protein
VGEVDLGRSRGHSSCPVRRIFFICRRTSSTSQRWCPPRVVSVGVSQPSRAYRATVRADIPNSSASSPEVSSFRLAMARSSRLAGLTSSRLTRSVPSALLNRLSCLARLEAMTMTWNSGSCDGNAGGESVRLDRDEWRAILAALDGDATRRDDAYDALLRTAPEAWMADAE